MQNYSTINFFNYLTYLPPVSILNPRDVLFTFETFYPSTGWYDATSGSAYFQFVILFRGLTFCYPLESTNRFTSSILSSGNIRDDSHASAREFARYLDRIDGLL